MVIELLDDLDLKIKALTKETKHYVEGFNCGNQHINNYLQLQGDCYEIAKTFILIDENAVNTIGFFSLCADSLLEKDGLDFIQAGSAIRINMFAIDNRYKGIRKIAIDSKPITFAHFLLIQCISIIKDIVEQYIGATYIVLHSTKEGYNLYHKIGNFEELDDEFSVIESQDNRNLKAMYRVIFEE